MTDEPTNNPCQLIATAAVPHRFGNGWIVWPPCSADQVAAAVAREREECAALCDDHASIEGIAQRCAAAIRAR